jgi:hypothetical protein
MRAAVSLDQDIAIAQESNPRKRAEMEREKRIAEDAQRIARETGLDDKASRKAAEMLNPEESTSGRKKIKGYSAAQYATNPYVDHRSFGDFFGKDGPQKAAAQRAGAQTNAKDPMAIMKAQLAALEKLSSY